MSEPAYHVALPDLTFYQQTVACQFGCPVRTDARGYVTAIAAGDYERAYLIARETNPFPPTSGWVSGPPSPPACPPAAPTSTPPASAANKPANASPSSAPGRPGSLVPTTWRCSAIRWWSSTRPPWPAACCGWGCPSIACRAI